MNNERKLEELKKAEKVPDREKLLYRDLSYNAVFDIINRLLVYEHLNPETRFLLIKCFVNGGITLRGLHEFIENYERGF